ncbi:MAG: prepilin-type N-terminal cleavage/methylation domain-containing protein [Planctomycetales bacterium]|nr:prepilin-type N-terminal cleavage/methylation domain-containing protein [Planctomycetales bacterium]MBN8624665.1 prepilin-type N-terminal cleavage/methylation domain-containing protein [Planctomycetota bacterium]
MSVRNQAGNLPADVKRRLARVGFTLVEMLVVITIIGMLMALVSVAVWKALERANQTKIIVEIGQLQSAIQAYKEKAQQYPPCLAQINIADRKVRFMRHVQIAFPNSNYATSSGTFDTIRNNLMAGNGVTSQPYNYKNAAGDIRQLDLNTLDQAEAIVFWLGGFPTPYNSASQNSIANRRIFGFHRDADAPFRRDALVAEGLDPLRYRTDPMYQFDETRLVDNDDDGWFEYIPMAQRGGAVVAPFVYFDSDSYTTASTGQGSALDISIYGYPRNGDAGAVDLAGQFGLAVPFAAFLDPQNSSPMRWTNPEGFQIICGGLDGMYAAPPETDLAQAMRVVIFPGGQVYSRATVYSEQEALSTEEQDNLTNLSNNTIEGARQELGK